MQRSVQMRAQSAFALMQRSVPLRQMMTVPGQNYVMPESVEDVIKSMDKERPQFTLLFFSAAWNPVCAKIQRDYENLTQARGEFKHIKVDCDAQPLVKQYFDARVEPQFLFLVNGGEVARVIGYNFEKLDAVCGKVVKATLNNEFGAIGDSLKSWERFYDEFDRWSRYGENDRDSFRATLESNTDTHRGPGISN